MTHQKVCSKEKNKGKDYPNDISKKLLFEIKISSVEGRFKTNKLINDKFFKDIKNNGILIINMAFVNQF